MIQLQFSTTEGLGSRVIRGATWSPYSHIDLVLRNGRLLGATARFGVSIRDPEPMIRVERFVVDAPATVIGAAASQLGRPYDWAGILGWGMRRNWQDQDAWFCSELIAWAFQAAGFPLLRAVDVWRVTPRDLLLSPLLQKEERGGDRPVLEHRPALDTQ